MDGENSATREEEKIHQLLVELFEYEQYFTQRIASLLKAIMDAHLNEKLEKFCFYATNVLPNFRTHRISLTEKISIDESKLVHVDAVSSALSNLKSAWNDPVTTYIGELKKYEDQANHVTSLKCKYEEYAAVSKSKVATKEAIKEAKTQKKDCGAELKIANKRCAELEKGLLKDVRLLHMNISRAHMEFALSVIPFLSPG